MLLVGCAVRPGALQGAAVIEPLMDIGDLAVTLKRPKSWVYDNYRKLGIEYVMVGNGVRFKPSRVAKWIDEHAC